MQSLIRYLKLSLEKKRKYFLIFSLIQIGCKLHLNHSCVVNSFFTNWQIISNERMMMKFNCNLLVYGIRAIEVFNSIASGAMKVLVLNLKNPSRNH